MSNPRILIVDDSAAIRRSLKNLILPLKPEIQEASNGKEALSLVQTETFDVILSDIAMDQMTGLEFCEALKKNPNTRHIPVIMVSSFDSDEDINKGFEAGAAAYISKSEAQELLCATVEDTLKRFKYQNNRLILVVDDAVSIRRIVENGLKEAGFNVITAENGKVALDLLETHKPELIISDIDMPVMNGFELCKVLHSDPVWATTPFIVMSANSDRGHMSRMLQQGAAAYICKPFNVDQLVIVAEKLLSDQFLMLLKERERLDSERNLMLATITSLVSALEARDPYTSGHSEAVGKILSGMLALTGVGKDQLEAAHVGGRLHDIGKIGVPDSVLLKPDRLTKEEFDHIKEHPTVGAVILQAIPSLSNILPIVQYHHERMDGKGYPAGLKGKEIPLWARMTAVADTYHALTSDRPYRKGMPQYKALQIINDVQGTQLCPDCVALFMKWIKTQK